LQLPQLSLDWKPFWDWTVLAKGIAQHFNNSENLNFSALRAPQALDEGIDVLHTHFKKKEVVWM